MYHDGINDLRGVLDRSKSMKVKRAALTALAQMPDQQLHSVYTSYLNNKDEGLREAAAEGFARLKDPGDRAGVENAFANERKTGPRLSLAFALVSMGKREMGEFDPLRYLVDNLNSAGYRGVARPYLAELARDPEVRRALSPALHDPMVTRDEKIGLAQVLSQSGDRDTLPALEDLSRDPDHDVAQEGLRALKNLRARLP
jgi:HEAT repeat protein